MSVSLYFSTLTHGSYLSISTVRNYILLLHNFKFSHLSLNIMYLSTSCVNQSFIHLHYSFFRIAYLYPWPFLFCGGMSVYF